MRRFVAIAAALVLALSPARAMDNPGPFALQLAGADFAIGAAGSQTGTPLTGLSGIKSASFQVCFAYGSGGTQVNVFIRASLDQGQTWFDIANIEFTTSSGCELVNLSADSAVTTPTAPSYLTLGNNATLNGFLGDRLEAVVISQGTYTGNSLVSVRGTAR
jgi:hypothetical protein